MLSSLLSRKFPWLLSFRVANLRLACRLPRVAKAPSLPDVLPPLPPLTERQQQTLRSVTQDDAQGHAPLDSEHLYRALLAVQKQLSVANREITRLCAMLDAHGIEHDNSRAERTAPHSHSHPRLPFARDEKAGIEGGEQS